jgi:MEMO1 family protein
MFGIRPCLRWRALDIQPVTIKGDELLYFHDRQGFAPACGVPRALAPLLGLFDGTRTVGEIIADFALMGGEELPEAFVRRIVEQLDESLLLDSPRFAAHAGAVEAEFVRNPIRPALHAGQSYPANPGTLRSHLTGYFEQAAQLPVESTLPAGAKVRGAVVPHIDFNRGGPVEALGYQPLLGAGFDVIVALGIAHCGVAYPWCAAAKDYWTPLGTARAEADFVAALQGRVGARLTEEQFAHKSEHSVEFVAVFLQYLEGLQTAHLVPILCGSLHGEARLTSSSESPGERREVALFCAALRETVAEWEAQGRRVGLIASVDLAHIGSRFGDDTPLTPARLRAIEAADREFLSCAAQGDAEALHAHIARDHNARNVDAHPALYTLLRAFPELRAGLLHYAQAFDAQANSVVSFAAMTLYEIESR